MTVVPDQVTKFQYTSKSMQKIFDFSGIVNTIQWLTDLTTAGQLTFRLLRGKLINPNFDFEPQAGDSVIFEWNNQRIFKGWVFQRELTEDDNWQITAYDATRYLKGTGSYAFNALSSSERFTKICQDIGIPYKDLDFDTWRSPAEIADGRTYFDMIQSAMNWSYQNLGKRFFLTDDGNGTILHTSTAMSQTDEIFTDKSLMTAMDFIGSIDSNVANYVLIVYQNSGNNSRQLYTAQDKDSMSKWGALAYSTNATGDNLNAAQLQNQANTTLKAMNREVITLKLTVLGNEKFKAGTGCKVSLPVLENAGLPANSKCFCTRVTQNFDNPWTMDLELVPENSNGFLGDNQVLTEYGD